MMFFQKMLVYIWHIPVCAVFHRSCYVYDGIGYDHDFYRCQRCNRSFRKPRKI